MTRKIAIVGAGGIGGYYGGLLALQGHKVKFIAHGKHLDAIRRNGLQVKSIHGDFDIRPTFATDSFTEVGPVDLVLVCIKTYSMGSILSELPALLGPETVVISLQNGIDASERLGTVIGMDHILGGATWISSAVESPGLIRQISQFRRIVIGELDAKITPRVQDIAALFTPTGITIEMSGNITKVLWTKFVFISAASGIGAVTRLALGDIRHVPETRELFIGLMREVVSIAFSEGIQLDTDVVEKTLDFIDKSDPNIKPSMQLDVERGRKFELDALIGVVKQKAKERHIQTPIADMVYASLLPSFLVAK